jgi:hypothetical protein
VLSAGLYKGKRTTNNFILAIIKERTLGERPNVENYVHNIFRVVSKSFG